MQGTGPTLHTTIIRNKALALGFYDIGFSKAERLEDEARHLEEWLANGNHGTMSYMENHFDKRVDPRLLVEGAKSVITLLFNYHNPSVQVDPLAPKISQYAYGKDYHIVVKEKLQALLQHAKDTIGDIHGRCFVDSAPVMERAWAERAGLGWIGKHSLMINKSAGSYFFLAVLIVDIPLVYDAPVADYCGTCTRCLDACPTGAIVQNKVVDASRCISYLTIERKDELPQEFKGKMEQWMFGCDICQQVCPWNRFAKPHDEPQFLPKESLLEMSAADWEEITEDTFKVIFKDSPVKRTKYEGLKRNIHFLK